MPVFVDPDGKIAYPTHRCVACGGLLHRAPGLTCNECLRHNAEQAAKNLKPTPDIDWNNWGVLPRK